MRLDACFLYSLLCVGRRDFLRELRHAASTASAVALVSREFMQGGIASSLLPPVLSSSGVRSEIVCCT